MTVIFAIHILTFLLIFAGACCVLLQVLRYGSEAVMKIPHTIELGTIVDLAPRGLFQFRRQ